VTSQLDPLGEDRRYELGHVLLPAPGQLLPCLESTSSSRSRTDGWYDMLTRRFVDLLHHSSSMSSLDVTDKPDAQPLLYVGKSDGTHISFRVPVAHGMQKVRWGVSFSYIEHNAFVIGLCPGAEGAGSSIFGYCFCFPCPVS
jgi:hypothetical protein